MNSKDFASIFKEEDKKTPIPSDYLFQAGNATVTYLNGVSTRKSTSKRMKDNLLQFPILISTSVDTATVVALNKALEHEYVNFVIVALKNIIYHNIEMKNGSPEVKDILKKIHTNLDDSDYSMKDFMNNAETVYNSRNEGIEFFVESIDIRDSNIIELNKLNEESLLYPVGEELNETILNEMSVPKKVLNEVKKEGILTEAYNKNNSLGSVKTVDYKKLNTLAPTLVSCKIMVKTGNGDPQPVEIVFGIKTILHPIESDYYVEVLNDVFLKGKFPVRLVKFLTGEMKLRDFFLDASNAKRKALRDYGISNGKHASDSYWWNKLEDMAKQDRIMRTVDASVGKNKQDSYMTAVTTLVITKAEAMRVKNKLNRNLMDTPQLITSIFEKFFIMNFVVVDEPAGAIFMYDPDIQQFEMYTIASLKAFANDEITADGKNSLFK